MSARVILGCLIFLIGGLYLVGCGGDGVGSGGDGLPPLQAEAQAEWQQTLQLAPNHFYAAQLLAMCVSAPSPAHTTEGVGRPRNCV